MPVIGLKLDEDESRLTVPSIQDQFRMPNSSPLSSLTSTIPDNLWPFVVTRSILKYKTNFLATLMIT